MGRFVVDIIQRIAQLESEQIGERTKMGMTQKAESGEGLMGFDPPFGYRLFEKRLVQDEEEAKWVSDIFFRYAAGESMNNIAWRLNREEVRTRRGNLWTVWSISQLLHNPIYAGWREWDNIRSPRIIERSQADLFNRVQQRISESKEP